MPDKGSYTNYDHGDLGDKTPGYDQDFDYPHLDDPRINDGEPENDLAVLTALLGGDNAIVVRGKDG